ncbi:MULTISPECIES: CoA transferase [unclassified Variovorax]|uniref:CoA transferase n=1 Tax=unclassified Variovorax TaxID=663243 RepID=UPI00076CF0B0|nr:MULTISPECIES: CoA transferase [unclassified Variovorax]KWT64438.1 Far-related protein [Variovorax sp. WDL1]PNG56309.1 E-cinnamoyl-CoA:R-phenyllactate CoA transferase [Variovorax sp. B4]PNG57733.1 E-cinnamoyl-CoA:R-phenyllactate CoA transferase [Variovorax sp. B2]VTV09836.1 Succinyl-CoA:(R)-benzylsuccinate CoA-transferase subunit BbsE [Variovorax sp. WDL1]
MPPSPDLASAPLSGVRVLSLALNLPGPAALMRCRAMGASCLKFEPPAGDPMAHYNRAAYAALHEGVRVETADLKTEAGLAQLHRALGQSEVLLTSFRPSALVKLGLGWEALHARHPALSQVAIVGAPGARAEEPGHDLTYLAESGLVTGTELPPTLYADMGGALLASEGVLKAVLCARAQPGTGVHLEVALNASADWLALPRSWGLTRPTGAVGGAHAGYRVYPCADGRVAVAALEPHFALRLCEAAGLGTQDMMAPATREGLAAWLRTRTRAELEDMARERDVPLLTLEA